jgi:hypothetical protein
MQGAKSKGQKEKGKSGSNSGGRVIPFQDGIGRGLKKRRE